MILHIDSCDTSNVDAAGDGVSLDQPTSDEDVAGIVPELTEDDIPGRTSRVTCCTCIEMIATLPWHYNTNILGKG